MPRILPITTWDGDIPSTTGWETDRAAYYLLKEDFGFLLLESGEKIILEEVVATRMYRPRYALYLLDGSGDKVLDNDGNYILLDQESTSNNITTGWN